MASPRLALRWVIAPLVLTIVSGALAQDFPVPTDGPFVNDGSWTSIRIPGQRGHTATYDPVRHRMIMYTGLEVWSLALTGVPVWTQLAPSGTAPDPRSNHAAVYDPIGDRLVVFGGSTTTGTLFGDVWGLSLAGTLTWTQLLPAGGPMSARLHHTMVYDSFRERIIVFGGDAGTKRNDVWELVLGETPTWTQLVPTGGPPAPRIEHTAIYDPAHDRMVVFGGDSGSFPYQNDVWELSLAKTPMWTQLSPSGGPTDGRFGHTAIHDPVGDRMIMFAGNNLTFPYIQRDVWAMSLSDPPAWSAVTPAGSLPAGRYQHTAIFDPVGDRMIVFGGNDGSGSGSPLGDWWELSLPGLPAWTDLGGEIPKGRHSVTAVYEPTTRRLVVFGGYAQSIGPSNETWFLSLGEAAPHWTLLPPLGSQPGPKYGHSAIYDPVGDRMGVFGGGDIPRSNEVWVLALSSNPEWSMLSPTGTPPSGRYRHVAVYDPVRHRMVVFGGDAQSGQFRNDVWTLTLDESPTWTQLSPLGTPPSGRSGSAAIYDPVRDRLVVFGGYDGSYLTDTWALSLGASPEWTLVQPSGPTGRSGHSAIYDPVRDRMVVFGGETPPTYWNQTWAFALSGPPVWSLLSPTGGQPSVRTAHAAAYDPDRDRMLLFGGYSGTFANDAWQLNWTESVAVLPEPPTLLSLSVPAPNPTTGLAQLRLALSVPAIVHAAVYDVTGRMICPISSGLVQEGVHTITWNGTRASAGPALPGVYFFHVAVDGRPFSRKVVRIR